VNEIYNIYSFSFIGLLCCHALEELNISYNNIATTNEVTKLVSLSSLSSLIVEGTQINNF